jgi:peptidoglycan LD-endopeptidase CwlK
MSSPLLKSDVLFAQRLLSSAGYYNGPLDGKWSTAMDKAEIDFDADYDKLRGKLGSFDPRTEKAIATLLPPAQQAARKFMTLAKTKFDVKLLSGLRTYAEQNALFAQGRTKPGSIVTKARGGFSNHNFGIAWDVGIFVNGKYLTGRNAQEEAQYKNLAALIMPKLGDVLTWGGDWKTIQDRPHYQLKAGDDVKRCRKLLEQGKAYA